MIGMRFGDGNVLFVFVAHYGIFEGLAGDILFYIGEGGERGVGGHFAYSW